jgi:hypothetical protein
VSRGKRSAQLFEDTALACDVLGILMDRAGLVKVVPAASTILMVEDQVWFEDRWMVASLCDE